MADTRTEQLRRRVEGITRQYDAHFAGQPRISRDPQLLDAMLAELDEVLQAAREVPGADDLVGDLQRSRELYAREAQAIREAQGAGPEALEAHHTATWAQFAFGRYRRHFAGQARATRDLGLMNEIIDDLKRLDREMAALSKRAETEELRTTRASLARNLAMYEEERGKIVAARGAGTLEEQGNILANVANEQFRVYRDHFAGKSRVSRRAAVLERVVGNLDQVLDRMKALKAQGLHEEHNDRNIGIVEERVGGYRKEVEAIREAKRQTTLPQLVAALGEAANAVFEEYRAHFAGQDRATRDLDLLNKLCESLFDLGRQMDDVDRVRDDANNQHNLAVVMDQLRLFDREFELIRELRQ